ncbi:AMIN-like domain-containing (lipo)protein [Cellulomonas sp. NPDC055163]
MRRTSVLAILLLVGSFLLVPASPAGAAPYCGIRWGSLEKSTLSLAPATVFDVRTGRHTCYDRLVVDLAGGSGGYRVAYVDEVTADGSGHVIPTRGGASLQITLGNPSYDDNGNLTYAPANPSELRNVSGYRTFRQVVWAGTFEGHTDLGLGVRARLPFRVFVLDGPGSGSRVVVDVAHRW